MDTFIFVAYSFITSIIKLKEWYPQKYYRNSYSKKHINVFGSLGLCVGTSTSELGTKLASLPYKQHSHAHHTLINTNSPTTNRIINRKCEHLRSQRIWMGGGFEASLLLISEYTSCRRNFFHWLHVYHLLAHFLIKERKLLWRKQAKRLVRSDKLSWLYNRLYRD